MFGQDTSEAVIYMDYVKVITKTAFWVYAQVGGQWDQINKASVDPFPNEAETLWNINTSLAYGAKGIQYFTVQEPIEFSRTDNPNQPDFNRLGVLGAVGNKTQWYYYVQKANKRAYLSKR